MLEIYQPLPPSAVIGPEAQVLQDALCERGASWFRAEPRYVALDGEAPDFWVKRWTSATSSIEALPSRPNKQAGRFDPHGMVTSMRFRAQMHCGYCVSGIAKSAERFSLALIYRSQTRNARTLFSVGDRKNTNILFGSESDGHLQVKDREGNVEVSYPLPPPDGRYTLLVVSCEPGKLRVKLNNLPAQEAKGTVTSLNEKVDLFIGCRSHRSGLLKTLGDSLISDVIYWPNRMVLSDAADPDFALLRDFWRWNR